MFPYTADLSVRGEGGNVIRLNSSLIAGSYGTAWGGWSLSLKVSQRSAVYLAHYLCAYEANALNLLDLQKINWHVQQDKKEVEEKLNQTHHLRWTLTIVHPYRPVRDWGQG